MINNLPKRIAERGILLYAIALVLVGLFFFHHMMSAKYIILGIVWVCGFFTLSSSASRYWRSISTQQFVGRLFVVAVALRVLWAIFSFFFYTVETGLPFEYGASDSLGYHNTATWFTEIGFENTARYIEGISISDAGYPLFLYFLYTLFGPLVFPVRIIKCFLSGWTCVIIYQLTKRTFGEADGRLAGIMSCFMPNLIFYCGLHLKETEMIFITVACINCIDKVIRQPKVNVGNILLAVALLMLTFTFRTVLGSAIIFSSLTAILLTNSDIIGKWKRITLAAWVVLALAFFASGTIFADMEKTWEGRESNQAAKREHQVNKGVKWAEYATGTTMAPLMFVLPFPTMVDVDEQYNQQMLNGANYVRNFLGIFVFIAFFNAFFRKKDWRNFTLLGIFLISYLGIICSSGFANSERFLLPGMPFLTIFAAHGICQLNKYSYRWVKFWYWLVPLMSLSWAFFKLGSRGLF